MAASRAGARVLAARAAASDVSLHGGVRVALVPVSPHFLDLFAPFVSIPTRVHQVIRPVRLWRQNQFNEPEGIPPRPAPRPVVREQETVVPLQPLPMPVEAREHVGFSFPYVQPSPLQEGSQTP